jgi:hypothetical protein
MSNPAARETITIVIGKSEALVLFDFLADFHQERSLDVNDNAERFALVRLHGALESTLNQSRTTMKYAKANSGHSRAWAAGRYAHRHCGSRPCDERNIRRRPSLYQL